MIIKTCKLECRSVNIRLVNPDCTCIYLRCLIDKLASYVGTSSTGSVCEMIGLNADIAGRDVVVVEDIVDSGLTMKYVTEMLAKYNPHSISICTLLLKPGNLKVDLDIPYKCFSIPNDFILGYGLDYDGYGRNTRDIYTVVE